MKPLIKHCLLTGIVIAIGFASCKKDNPVNPTNTTTSSVAINSLQTFYSAYGVKAQTFTLNANTGGSFTGKQGTKFTFGANSFLTPSNTTATGNVTVQIKELYSNADMLLSNMPTMSGNLPLLSGGEYYIAVSQGSMPLHLASGVTYTVQMPMVDTLPLNFFNGVDSAGMVNWKLNPDSITNYVVDTFPDYLVACDSLNWGNADMFYSGPFYTDTVIANNCPAGAQISISLFVNGHHAIWGPFQKTSKPTKFVSPTDIPAGINLTMIGLCITSSGNVYSSFLPFTNPGNIQNLTMNFAASDSVTFVKQLKALK